MPEEPACLRWGRESSVEGETGKKRGTAEQKSAPTYLGKGEGTRRPVSLGGGQLLVRGSVRRPLCHNQLLRDEGGK